MWVELITISIVTIQSIWHNSATDFFAFWKIFVANLQILWRHLPTEIWNLYCFVKEVYCSNRWHKLHPNRSIKGDAIPPQTPITLTKNVVLNLTFNCGAIGCHRQKKRYSCTTTVPQIHKCPKHILENLLPVWLLGHTNLFIQSRFWTTSMNFDNLLSALCSVMWKQFYISAHLCFLP